MIERERKRKPGAGRPELPDLEKMRRKVKRAELKVEELAVLAETEQSIEELEETKRRGRPPLSAKEKYKREMENFRMLFKQLREREKELGEEHVDLSHIEDPALDKLGMPKVGRPSKDEFTLLDQKLALALRELEKAEAMPEEIEQPQLGRRRLTKAERIRRVKIEINILESKVASKETELDEIGMQKRKLKKSRDLCRSIRKHIKATENNESVEVMERDLIINERKVEEEAQRLKYLEEQEDNQGKLDKIRQLIAQAESSNDPCRIALLRQERILLEEEHRLRVALAAFDTNN